MANRKFETYHTNRNWRLIGRAYEKVPPSKRYPRGVPPRLILQLAEREEGVLRIGYKPRQTVRIALGEDPWVDTSKEPFIPQSYEFRSDRRAFESLALQFADTMAGGGRAYRHVVTDCLNFLFPKE